MNIFSFVFAFALFILTTASVSSAQTTADISGTITDASGAAIAGAAVKIVSTGTGAERSVTANDSGSFTVPQLQPGVYTITATLQGFKTAQLSRAR